MRILFATNHLWAHTGSEEQLLGLAASVADLGHEVGVYAPHCDESRLTVSRGVLLGRESLRSFAPDAVYCQHYPVALVLRSLYPEVPMVLAHLGVVPELEQAPLLGRPVGLHLALSEEVRSRLLDQGIFDERIVLFRNAIDTDRFLSVGARGRTARCFSYKLGPETLGLLAEASRTSGFDWCGEDLRSVGGETPGKIATVLSETALVFASGRCALEAALAGAAVVVVGPAGLDGALTLGSLDEMMRTNFSGRGRAEAATPEALSREVRRALAEDRHTLVGELVRRFDVRRRGRTLVELLGDPRALAPRLEREELVQLQRFERLLEVQREMSTWQLELERAISRMPVDELLSKAGRHWNAGQQDLAHRHYVAALAVDGKSLDTLMHAVGFLLVQLSAAFARHGDETRRKRALEAYLKIQPRNHWVVSTLARLAASSHDEALLVEIERLISDWSLDDQREVRQLLSDGRASRPSGESKEGP